MLAGVTPRRRFPPKLDKFLTGLKQGHDPRRAASRNDGAPLGSLM
jgi:hypothetical protein